MNDQDFGRVGEIFKSAIDLDEEARAAYVREACGENQGLLREVEQMLSVYRQPDELLDAGPGAAVAKDYETSHDLVTRTIGSYRIIRHIASGGMGAVYEAEQEHPRRRVAVKVLNTALGGEELRRRFERETEILGELQHPGIAQILEAGTYSSEGGVELPFIAMELVAGTTIVEYVRSRELTPRDCALLFARLCDAVEYAHQRGVVHRDLKPANILVDESGQPKVLDFGVARMVGADLDLTTLVTQPGVLLGTLAYMSPEQARGDVDAVDARADVHALGVLLFELLSGRLPYDLRGCPIQEAVRLLNEDEPTTLSSIDQSLHGDLETIVHKAIEKEPERRYSSAVELRAEIQRYLSNEPIHARPPSRAYRLRKFTRRHRTLVVASTLIAASLVAGTVVSTMAALDAREQTRLADEALLESQRGMEKLHEMLSVWRASSGFGQLFSQDGEIRRIEIEIIERSAPGFRDAWKAIDLDKVHTGSGFSSHFRRRGELLVGLDHELSPVARRAVAGLLLSAAWEFTRYSSGEEPLRMLQRAEELLTGDLGAADPRLQVTRAFLADNLHYLGRHDEGLRLTTAWLDELVGLGLRDDTLQVALYRSRKAASLVGLGRYAEAEPLLEGCGSIVERAWGAVLAFEVKAARVALLEGQGYTSAAEELRSELARDACLSRAKGPVHIRAALGPRRASLCSALESLQLTCEQRGVDPAQQLDDVLRLMIELGVRDDSAEAGLVAVQIRLAANWYGNKNGWYRDTTLTISQLALRMLRAGSLRMERDYGLMHEGIALVHSSRHEFEKAASSAREGLTFWVEKKDNLYWNLRRLQGDSLGEMGCFEEGHALLLACYRGQRDQVGLNDPLTR